MSDGTAVGRAPDHRKDPQQEEGSSMSSSTIVHDQTVKTMHEAVAPRHLASRTSIQVSGKEIFLRSLPTIAFVAIALLILSNPPGVFWGTAFLVVLIGLMVLSIRAWIPRSRSR